LAPAVRPIGYITDQYPATSHTFVQREVLALRRHGVDVRTFSIHRVGPEHVLSQADRQAQETSYALLPPRPGHLLAAHLTAALSHPIAYCATVAYALQIRGESPRVRFWQIFYLGEAILLWWRCRRLGVRHVHAHFTSPGADVAHMFGRFARRAYSGGASWSFTGHGADIANADQRTLAVKVRDADFVVCVSDYGRSQLMMLVEEEHWEKIHVVRCGVEVNVSGAEAAAPSNGVPDVLAVGRLVSVKGHGVLLKAIAELAASGEPVTATIVGDGPRRASLERLAQQLGIADRITFAGRVGQDDIGRYYEHAQVFCLPSFFEGLPVVLLEAMAFGVPVVASRVAGIPELIEDGRSGVLVPPGRADLFADAVRSLLADGGRRAALAAEARRRVASQFQVDASAERLRELMLRHGALRQEASAPGIRGGSDPET
jgi:colanic acid/amylovoran biosynthesis glycosyltransferase